VGAYHFFRPQRDPLRQATEFAETAMQLSHLRPVVDWETLGGMTARDATSAVLCFVNATERLWGVKPILYSYPSMLEQIVYPAAAARLAALAEVCDLWVAHYGAPKPWIPKPWTEVNCLAWQFDGDGFLRLPNGVDCDFDWFMGDEAELVRRWGYTPPMVLAPTTISIRDAQHVLLRLGYRLPIYGADGLSGAETTAALKAFQATIGIPADGRLNPATQSALLLTLSRIG
jgi:lysozyme